jgi:hypothetical protein
MVLSFLHNAIEWRFNNLLEGPMPRLQLVLQALVLSNKKLILLLQPVDSMSHLRMLVPYNFDISVQLKILILKQTYLFS